MPLSDFMAGGQGSSCEPGDGGRGIVVSAISGAVTMTTFQPLFLFTSIRAINRTEISKTPYVSQEN